MSDVVNHPDSAYADGVKNVLDPQYISLNGRIFKKGVGLHQPEKSNKEKFFERVRNKSRVLSLEQLRKVNSMRNFHDYILQPQTKKTSKNFNKLTHLLNTSDAETKQILATIVSDNQGRTDDLIKAINDKNEINLNAVLKDQHAAYEEIIGKLQARIESGEETQTSIMNDINDKLKAISNVQIKQVLAQQMAADVGVAKGGEGETPVVTVQGEESYMGPGRTLIGKWLKPIDFVDIDFENGIYFGRSKRGTIYKQLVGMGADVRVMEGDRTTGSGNPIKEANYIWYEVSDSGEIQITKDNISDFRLSKEVD